MGGYVHRNGTAKIVLNEAYGDTTITFTSEDGLTELVISGTYGNITNLVIKKSDMSWYSWYTYSLYIDGLSYVRYQKLSRDSVEGTLPKVEVKGTIPISDGYGDWAINDLDGAISIASTDNRGVVQVGDGLSITGKGVLSVERDSELSETSTKPVQNKVIAQKLNTMQSDIDDAISLGITGASAGQVPVVNSVDENGVPNGWGVEDLPSGEVKLIASCTLEETAEAIEFTGLNVKNKPISIRISNTGSSCGNGWYVSVNGATRGNLAGSSKSTSGNADNRIFLIPDGSTLRGVAACVNGAILHFSWTDFQSPITSIRLTSGYHRGDGTMYYGIGTAVEIYEGIFPNIS